MFQDVICGWLVEGLVLSAVFGCVSYRFGYREVAWLTECRGVVYGAS